MTHQIHSIALEPTYDGQAEAVLVEVGKILPDQVNILYLPGFCDYYFHDHLAQRFIEEKYNFYALDFRRYARAKKEHQKIYYIEAIEEYFEEIEKAIQFIEKKSDKGIVIMGHSTGGLTTSLFAEKYQNTYNIKALVLNSPFFEFYLPKNLKKALSIAPFISYFNRYAKMPTPKNSGLVYTMSLHKKYQGEWDYDLTYKTEKDIPVFAKWIMAVSKAHKKLQSGLDLNIPTLILHSDKSMSTLKWKPEVTERDIVLNVEHIKKYGDKVSKRVEMVEIPGAIHDVFLSKKEAREMAIQSTIKWLKQNI